MHLFGATKEHGARVAVGVVFDIGSASVGAALVLLRPGAKPHILYNTRRHMVFQDEFNFDRFFTSMLGALSSVAHDVERNGLSHLTFPKGVPRRVNRILCTYSSPWYLSETRIITLKKEKPFVFSHDVVESMVHEQEAGLATEASEQYGGAVGTHVDIVEQAVTGIKLNGYPVHNPYGKRVLSLEFVLTTSAVSSELRARVEDTIGQVFHIEHITHHSFALVGCVGIARHLNTPGTFLCIDVSGEVTDIALVVDGGLIEIVSFPRGARHVLRELNRSLNMSADEARTLLALRESGVVQRDTGQKLEASLGTVKSAWLRDFAAVLDTFTTDVQLPRNVFLTASEWAGGLFRSFMDDTSGGRRMKTTLINGALLQPYITFREKTAPDVFLALATLSMDDGVPVLYPRRAVASRR